MKYRKVCNNVSFCTFVYLVYNPPLAEFKPILLMVSSIISKDVTNANHLVKILREKTYKVSLYLLLILIFFCYPISTNSERIIIRVSTLAK